MLTTKLKRVFKIALNPQLHLMILMLMLSHSSVFGYALMDFMANSLKIFVFQIVLQLLLFSIFMTLILHVSKIVQKGIMLIPLNKFAQPFVHLLHNSIHMMWITLVLLHVQMVISLIKALGNVLKLVLKQLLNLEIYLPINVLINVL